MYWEERRRRFCCQWCKVGACLCLDGRSETRFQSSLWKVRIWDCFLLQTSLFENRHNITGIWIQLYILFTFVFVELLLGKHSAGKAGRQDKSRQTKMHQIKWDWYLTDRRNAHILLSALSSSSSKSPSRDIGFFWHTCRPALPVRGCRLLSP